MAGKVRAFARNGRWKILKKGQFDKYEKEGFQNIFLIS